MEEINIMKELKIIHQLIGKNLFDIHNKKKLSTPPSPLQMDILSILIEEKEDIFLKTIQERLHISKAAISDAIEKMEKKGFIEKQNYKEDGRKNKLVVLKKGKDIYKELLENKEKMNQKMMVGISEEEMNTFQITLKKIEKNLRKEGNMDDKTI